MLVNFAKDLADINKKDIPKEDGSGVLQARDVCVNALIQPWKDDKPDGNLKLKWWRLACAIRDSDGSLDVSIEDLATIKDRIAKFYATTIVGQVYEILESAGK